MDRQTARAEAAATFAVTRQLAADAYDDALATARGIHAPGAAFAPRFADAVSTALDAYNAAVTTALDIYAAGVYGPGHVVTYGDLVTAAGRPEAGA